MRKSLCGSERPRAAAREQSGYRSSSGGDAGTAQARVTCGGGKGTRPLCVLIAGAGAWGQAGRERAAGDPPSTREAVDGEMAVAPELLGLAFPQSGGRTVFKTRSP